MIKVIVVREDSTKDEVREFLTDRAAHAYAKRIAFQLGVEPVKDRQGDWAVIE